jgi:monooxygenase
MAPRTEAEAVEHVDVLVVGAGLSGICAAHYIRSECPWASCAILEARDAIGGTWDLFRYPGVRSDSDMYTLGYSFRPWDRDDSIAEGPAILDYIRETAAEEGLDRLIRFHHRVVRADWSTEDARWHVTVELTGGLTDGQTDGAGDASGETVELTCGFFFSCTGYYRYDHGHEPPMPGIDRFRGPVVHPQHWPEDLDTAGRRIVVVGSGATAVTLVPALAQSAAHVTMLQRTPTYIISVPSRNPLVNRLRRMLPERWSAPVVRWLNALVTQGSFRLSRRRPELVKRLIRKQLESELPEGFDVDRHFTPPYDPWDQRMCVVPDGDLFEAVRSGRTSIVTDQVDTFTETGIRLRSGDELDADVVVTATGLELLFIGGVDLRVDGEPVDPADRLTYKGMMLEGVPNLAIAIGYTNASWTLKCELTCRYVARLLGHMHRRRLRQCTPVNRDASTTAAPLLGLTSGYVQRSAHLFPKQGSRSPWQVHQSYLADHRELKRAPIEDGAMQFTNPEPAGTTPARITRGETTRIGA